MTNSQEEALLSAAIEATEQGRFEDAEAKARAILAFNADSVEGHQLLANALVRRNQPDAALEVFDKAVALSPQNPSLLLQMALFFQTRGHMPEATECYRKCSELQPEDGYAREMHSQSLLEQWMFALTRRKIGREASKSYAAKQYSGFFRSYLSGANILDIGFRGGHGEAQPIVPQATGIDLGYPGYDGIHLPFPDNSQDAVYSSHCLEHMQHLPEVIREWLRVVKVGGYVVAVVPHQYLYERRRALPSQHPNHIHFFTPSTLLATFEEALPPNHYRVRHLMDNDLFYDYSLPPSTHPVGCYEIELVLEKIAPPAWDLV